MRTTPVVLVGTFSVATIVAAAVALPDLRGARDHPSPEQVAAVSVTAAPPTAQEQALQNMVAAGTADTASMVQLARLQEGRGALADAQATLLTLHEREPTNGEVMQMLARVQVRAGDVTRAMETLDRAAAADPGNPSLHHLIATHYYERSRDPRLSATERRTYLEQGVAAEDRALAADPNHFDALVYKSLLLRELAAGETKLTHREALIRDADALRARALALGGPSASPALAHDFTLSSSPPPPPPPPVPGAGEIQWSYATTSYTVIGSDRTPEKVKDVRPVYPPMALRGGIQGTVVVEAAVDRRGHVVSARVVESVPLLSQATIDAVRQWQFDPATVDPAGERILLTVKATFIPR